MLSLGFQTRGKMSTLHIPIANLERETLKWRKIGKVLLTSSQPTTRRVHLSKAMACCLG